MREGGGNGLPWHKNPRLGAETPGGGSSLPHKSVSIMSNLQSSSTGSLSSSSIYSESRRSGLSWTTAEGKIRKLHRAPR